MEWYRSMSSEQEPEMPDTDLINEVFEVAQAIEADYEYEYIGDMWVQHGCDRLIYDTDNYRPHYWVEVAIEIPDEEREYGSVFPHGLSNFARRRGMFLHQVGVRFGEDSPTDFDAELVLEFALEKELPADGAEQRADLFDAEYPDDLSR